MKRIISAVLFMVVIFCFTGCNSTNALVGEWKTLSASVDTTENIDDNYFIRKFNSDGSGVVTDISFDRQTAHLFSYEIDGDTLTITSKSGTEVEECTYSVDNGILTLEFEDRTEIYSRYN